MSDDLEARLRAGIPCNRHIGDGGAQCGKKWMGEPYLCADCQKKLEAADRIGAVQRLETEAMQDAARGIMQILRARPGCTEADVYAHCKARGDSVKGLHEHDRSYVTEARATAMIWRAMYDAAQGEGKCGSEG